MNKLKLANSSALLSPKRLMQPPSWSGHIPFAMWLIAQIKPETLVELGTHSGNSYFSFCQAVQTQTLSTRCYAVDTWEGDPQAGYYGDEVYADVEQYNAQHYADFSKLLRMPFDEALSHFDESSIDLLHIDGLHTYAVVRHDFETWKPKLSDKAIVLFHDIAVRSGDFGVWQLWEELTPQYPSIQFEHSNGLGVLFVGKQQSETVQDLLDNWTSPSQQQQITVFFEQLGKLPTAELCINDLQRIIAEYDHLVQGLQGEVHGLKGEVLGLQGEAQGLQEEVLGLQKEVLQMQETAEKNAKRIKSLAVKCTENKTLQGRIQILTTERDSLLASTSWRLTRPLRLSVQKIRDSRVRLVELLRALYQRLPLTLDQRAALRSRYYRSRLSGVLMGAQKQLLTSFVSPYTSAAMNTAPAQILVVERSIPRPNQDAGSAMIANFIRVLRQMGYAVTFIPCDLAYDSEYTLALQSIGVECLHQPVIGSIEEHLSHYGERYDYILSCRPDQTEALLPLFQLYSPQAHLLYETHDLHFVREQRQAEMEQDAALLAHAKWRKQQEMRIAAAVDCTLVVSEQERQILLQEDSDLAVEVIPVVGEIYGCRGGYEQRKDLIFIGGYQHRPNVDAVIYFVKEILPLIVEKIPQIKFLVVGSHPPAEISALASEHVIVHGFVPDITAMMNHVRISVNPLRFGAGVKGKLVTSMAYGVPCVGTRIAVEGMDVIAGKHALVADGASNFAAEVIRLYTDQHLWQSLSRTGLAFIRQNFSLDVATAAFTRIFSHWPVQNNDHHLALTQVNSYAGYRQQISATEQQRRQLIETNYLEETASISTRGFCFVCAAEVALHTDFSFAFSQPDGSMVPNWRERMVCPQCRLNNRMRAAIHLFHLLCAPNSESHFYLTEQTTPMFSWFRNTYANVTGSEFLGDTVPLGELNSSGIRNENLTQLTFSDEQFDTILSFDVFEHVPDYLQAFQSCLRCLKPGGSLFFSVPFALSAGQNIVRASINASGDIQHLLPPEYHGDPLNSEGCLCYYHFGWELLDQLRSLGFREASAYLYWSDYFGYLGGEQLIFRAIK